MSGCVARVEPVEDGVQIRTIGYGARSIGEFIEAIQAAGAEYLVDVRSVPHSKYKPEFSREPLGARLEQSGIQYVFMGDALGGRPDDPSCYGLDGRVDYASCRMRPSFVRGLESLEAGWEAGHQIVLMCSEGKPEECHRTKLVAEELIAAGVPVAHIDENGRSRSHRAVMDLITDGQGTLFGEHAAAATSRKRHRIAS
jgi:uncharacterized protein (DUF488 family)